MKYKKIDQDTLEVAYQETRQYLEGLKMMHLAKIANLQEKVDIIDDKLKELDK